MRAEEIPQPAHDCRRGSAKKRAGCRDRQKTEIKLFANGRDLRNVSQNNLQGDKQRHVGYLFS